MYQNDYDYMLRLLIVGNSSVGKTCLLRRFSEGQFNQNFIPTVGIDFAVKNLKIDNKIVKVQIFDTAGQERFKSIISSYFRNADGILVVYDVTDKQSFEDLQDYWIRDIRINCQENVKLILLGNKSDLEDQRQVSKEQGIKLAEQMQIVSMETSAKTEQGVREAFEAIVKDIYYKKKIEEPTTQTGGFNKLDTKKQKKQKNKNDNSSGGCC
ncbi:P-loop containing nucleoside triphosphate hydrolase [Pseudocohnilembus persalinus]|uniref:p-loop containing nucleoside triphosphate hydrolase n=1 Tax=Pseudocohnilembus persalinus TaxID=266149 RepID=A0A0V0R786_PSEPJ|nr:P-loop containing nucleoside triphosphate hydrolase [Pseudocohnilembus persalinus]|eukprot:KRX10339.1 P-loop containing nucleoside triphosphate hydrolase [Pseudocohnilembus persalinus]